MMLSKSSFRLISETLYFEPFWWGFRADWCDVLFFSSFAIWNLAKFWFENFGWLILFWLSMERVRHGNTLPIGLSSLFIAWSLFKSFSSMMITRWGIILLVHQNSKGKVIDNIGNFKIKYHCFWSLLLLSSCTCSQTVNWVGQCSSSFPSIY